jgi:small GTP-binding protein
MKMPAFIRAKDLGKKLGIDVDRIEKYAREEGLKFRKASDIILNFPLIVKFLESFNIKCEYEELDAVRSDYWDSARRSMDAPTRPSVISVMGDIDHGKTSLLDALSNSSVAQFEPGKITQSLSAFTVDLDPSQTSQEADWLNSPSRVTFLDTPGHGAFENMRTSGASVSDFILLVISCIEGVTKATQKILTIARQYNVPIVVAINKIDIATEDQIKGIYKALREAKASKIKRSKNVAMLGNFKDLFRDVDDDYPVVAIVEISATNHMNMDILKRVVKELHLSMEENLHVDPNQVPAEATVIESYSSPGLGRVLLLISHLGTLSLGSHFVVNNCTGQIKSLRLADSRYLSSDTDLSAGGPMSTSSSSSQRGQDQVLRRQLTSQPATMSSAIGQPNTSKEILEGSIGSTISLQSVGAGLPVLVSGLKQEHFVPAGSPFFQYDSKDKVDSILEFRQTVMEYASREKDGLLYRPDWIRNKAENGEEQDLDFGEEALDEMEEEQARKWADEDNDKFHDERQPTLSVVVKADNQGRLDALILSAKETAAEMGFSLKMLVKGIGNVTTHDLTVVQVENEENGVPRIPLFLFNVGFDSNTQHWLAKKPHVHRAIEIKPHNVFLDILKELRAEIKHKLDRQTRLPPLPVLHSSTSTKSKTREKPSRGVPSRGDKRSSRGTEEDEDEEPSRGAKKRFTKRRL